MQAKLRDAQIGDVLLGFYALTRCELIPYTGGVRLQIELSDASGKMAGILWNEEAEAANAELRDAAVVKVKGIVSSYRNAAQIQIERIRPAKPEEFDASELLPSSVHSREELEAAVDDLIALIDDEATHQLVVEIIYDESVRDRYFQSPAGTRWHHGYLRGLAEHSISMARAALKLAEHYSHLNRSLLIAGALLHDIGKITELQIGSTFEYSTDGRLFGHMVIGYEMVSGAAVRLGLQDDVNIKKLLHMVLSHQGKKEYSAPVEPAFEEAFVLYFVDEIDSKLNAIARIRNKPEHAGKNFSDWVQLLGTYLYLENKPHPGGEPNEL